MTTFQVREDQALADALTELMGRLGPDHAAVSAVSQMRASATPGNGYGSAAAVPWAIRGKLAEELRTMASEGHPLAAELGGLADGLDATAAARSLNS